MQLKVRIPTAVMIMVIEIITTTITTTVSFTRFNKFSYCSTFFNTLGGQRITVSMFSGTAELRQLKEFIQNISTVSMRRFLMI